MRSVRLTRLVLAPLLMLAAAGPARAETTQCTVLASLPATIGVSGIYCLDADFNLSLASGSAITIAVNNVILDLNGHRIGNLAAGIGTTAVGIHAVGRSNLTIRNGSLRGFRFGVQLHDPAVPPATPGHIVEDLRIDNSTQVGIFLFGRNSIVRRNMIVATGGGPGTVLTTGDAYGVLIAGVNNRVIDNDVIGVVDVSGPAPATGVRLVGGAADHGLVVNNRVTGAETGFALGSATVKYRDNLTTNVGTSFVSGTAVGTNN